MRRDRARVAAFACGGLMAMAAFACSTASNTLQGVTERRPASGPAVDEHVIIGSPALGKELTFGDVVSRREGLLLHVQVALENQSKHTVDFEYRWEWTDADGFQLGDTLSAWQPTVVNGRERKLLRGVGPGPAAVNFRLYVRKPEG